MADLFSARLAAPSDPEELKRRAAQLKLHGLLAHWQEYGHLPWVETLLEIEGAVRRQRSLDRRLKATRLKRFKLLADFDWSWPSRLDRELVEELFELDFLKEDSNVVFLGANGLGKTMLAQNLVQQAVLRGHTALATSASELLNDLAEQDSTSSLARRLQKACRPQLLLIDEVGYQSYNSRHADLLFEVLDRRHQHQRSTIITTNRDFEQWSEVFPNSSCVVALVDRLLHRAEIVGLEGDSYRLKEAKERQARKAAERKARRRRKKGAG